MPTMRTHHWAAFAAILAADLVLFALIVTALAWVIP